MRPALVVVLCVAVSGCNCGNPGPTGGGAGGNGGTGGGLPDGGACIPERPRSRSPPPPS